MENVQMSFSPEVKRSIVEELESVPLYTQSWQP